MRRLKIKSFIIVVASNLETTTLSALLPGLVALDGEPVSGIDGLQRLLGAQKLDLQRELTLLRHTSKLVRPIVPIERQS